MALPPNGSFGKHGVGVDPRAHEEARRRDQRRQDQIADQCAELEESLEQLRTRYELFFVGVERREPSRERDEMKRAIGRIKGESSSVNTGLRFRIDTLHARFVSYERMWLRSGREKEEGTYRRDLQRLRRKAKGPEPVKKEARAPEASTGGPAPSSAGPPTPEAPPVAKPAVVPSSSAMPATKRDGSAERPEALSAEQLRALYVAYVDAKKRCHEDVSRITYEALAKTITRQVPELLARYQAKSVEFRVLIKDGKAFLKAIPRT